MKHKCALKNTDTKLTWFERLRLISPDNSLGLSKFRSDVSVREEQQRHLKINRYAIHPFSMFRAWYEVYLTYLYGSVLITKPIDAGFIKISVSTYYLSSYVFYTILTDFLCWIDIILHFFTGMEVPGSNVIELRTRYIARQYVFGPYFIFDLLSSIPKTVLFYIHNIWFTNRHLVGIIDLFSLLKLLRIISFLKYVKRTAERFSFTSKGMHFMMCSLLLSMLVFHWMACLQFAVPKLVRRSLSPKITNHSWFFEDLSVDHLYNKDIILQYTHCLFKSSAYILGIRIDIYKMAQPEEYMLAIATYFIGKILIAFIWIILAVAILSSRVMNIKYLEVINQLEEYMRQKQLPLNLRDRILQFFFFKYRNRFFHEEMINSMLSENLKRDASMHICKALIKNVSLFCELSPIEISKIVNYLVPEIYLPNDVIIRAGTYGKVMYFLSSGTVAVYTRSGREICHLQDGAYFGEIALVLKNNLRMASIIALETTHVYKLSKRDLEKCLLINKVVRNKILKEAEERLKETTKLEEEYKELLYEQTFKKIT